MEKTTATIEAESDILFLMDNNSPCSVCGETFKKPLLATLISDNQAFEYYACPRCLSRVKYVENRSKVTKVEESAHEAEEEENADSKEQTVKMDVEEKPEESFVCTHGFGYLKRRPKNTSIPDQCLTCTKMIDCM